jgi:hypothetical protein
MRDKGEADGKSMGSIPGGYRRQALRRMNRRALATSQYGIILESQ